MVEPVWLNHAAGAVSSVGRAPARQAGGHWFEPSTAHEGSPANAGFSYSRGRTRRQSCSQNARTDCPRRSSGRFERAASRFRAMLGVRVHVRDVVTLDDVADLTAPTRK